MTDHKEMLGTAPIGKLLFKLILSKGDMLIKCIFFMDSIRRKNYGNYSTAQSA